MNAIEVDSCAAQLQTTAVFEILVVMRGNNKAIVSMHCHDEQITTVCS